MKIAAICAVFAALTIAVPVSAKEAGLEDARAEAYLDPSGRQAVEGINSFSLNLYRLSVSMRRNLFISPISVSTAVALAYRGARGDTAEALRLAMHYGASPEAYLPVDAAILKALNFAGDGRELSVANGLWVEQSLSLRPDFLADVARYARANIRRVDFRGNSDVARLTINRWVAAATNDRIKDLLHQGDVTEDTRVALVSSIYWKGRWETPFPIGKTKTEPFHSLSGERTPTSLMHRQSEFRVCERDGVKAIELPYAFNDVSMIVLLPNSATGLPRFESRLNSDELNRWLGDLDAAQPRDAIVTLPRLHLEWRDDLVPSLQALGAATAFSDRADFSGMTGEPFPSEVPKAESLKIGKVVHQASLDVDEKGSEAAAATAVLEVIVSRVRRGSPPPPPFVFRADKPFLFLIRDRRTGLILFIGRYVTPER